mgnify:CR=1 FL=1
MSKEKKVGFILESNTRIAKLSFIKAFKKLNVDVTPEQWVILDNLSHTDGLTQTELANRSFKNTPTISRIIDVLAKKEFLIRKADIIDRRKQKVFLTNKGKEVVECCKEEISTLRQISWAGLTDEDYEEFLRITSKIFENFQRYD